MAEYVFVAAVLDKKEEAPALVEALQKYNHTLNVWSDVSHYAGKLVTVVAFSAKSQESGQWAVAFALGFQRGRDAEKSQS